MYDINSLRYIVVSICDLCNEQCDICPHKFKEWKENHKDVMSIDSATILKKRLDEINYKGIVSISGMGEPLLNPYINNIIDILSKDRSYTLQIITNGTVLLEDNELLKYLLDRIDRLDISIHDMSRYDEFKTLQISDKVTLRNHDYNDKDNTLIMNNRAGAMNEYKYKELERTNTHAIICCYYPYYEIAIDCDGYYLWCAHDWNKYSKDYKANIRYHSIDWYFLKYTRDKKKNMYNKANVILNGGLDYPCRYCNCCGVLDGEKEMEEFFKQEDKRRDESWLNRLLKFLS